MPSTVSGQRVRLEHIALSVCGRAQIEPVGHWQGFPIITSLDTNAPRTRNPNNSTDGCNAKQNQTMYRCTSYCFWVSWWLASSKEDTPCTVLHTRAYSAMLMSFFSCETKARSEANLNGMPFFSASPNPQYKRWQAGHQTLWAVVWREKSTRTKTKVNDLIR